MLFFSFLFNLSFCGEIKTAEKERSKVSKFTILSFSPETIDGKGGDLVTITVDKNLSSLVFCKFDDKEVTGRKDGDFVVKCVSPRIRQKEAFLSVSENKVKWSLPVKIGVVPEMDTSSVSFVLVLFFVFVGIGFSAMSIFGKKKKKGHKKRHLKRNTVGEAGEGKKRIKRRKQTNLL